MKFYELTPGQRRDQLKGLDLEKIDKKELNRLNGLSENVIGAINLPLSVIPTLMVNNRLWMVPMTTEEPSVVAAANHGASVFNRNHGVEAISKREGIWGQIVLRVNDKFVLTKFERKFALYLDLLNHEFSSLIGHGGSIKKITATQTSDLLKLLVLVDPADAMGANRVNTILEFFAGYLLHEKGIEEKLFAILSNYPTQLTSVEVKLSFDTLNKEHGKQVAQKISLLSKIGQTDVYRAVTNNKGIMNGVDAILLATGNDYRAVEAANAVLAAHNGYHSLSDWHVKDDYLEGKLTLSLPIGVVGGSIRVRSDVQQSYRVLQQAGSFNVTDLANIIASVGLANNFAALNAIATTGIQEGHMKLQARNVTNLLNASDEEKQYVYQQMLAHKRYNASYAQDLLKQFRKGK